MSSPTLFRSVTRVTSAVVAVFALVAGLIVGLPMAASAADVTDGLVLKYDLTQASGTTVVDSSGNGKDGTLNGGGTWGGASGLTLDGTDDYVKLPNNIMAGLSSITVSTEVYIEPTQADAVLHLGPRQHRDVGVGHGLLLRQRRRLPHRPDARRTGRARRSPPRARPWPAASGRPSPTPRPARPARCTRTASQVAQNTARHGQAERRSAAARRPTTTSASPTTRPTSSSRASCATSASTTGR